MRGKKKASLVSKNLSATISTTKELRTQAQLPETIFQCELTVHSIAQAPHRDINTRSQPSTRSVFNPMNSDQQPLLPATAYPPNSLTVRKFNQKTEEERKLRKQVEQELLLGWLQLQQCSPNFLH